MGKGNTFFHRRTSSIQKQTTDRCLLFVCVRHLHNSRTDSSEQQQIPRPAMWDGKCPATSAANTMNLVDVFYTRDIIRLRARTSDAREQQL